MNSMTSGATHYKVFTSCNWKNKLPAILFKWKEKNYRKQEIFIFLKKSPWNQNWEFVYLWIITVFILNYLSMHIIIVPL